MKVVPKKHPAEFVEPSVPEARERQMWNRIDERLHPTQRSTTRWLAPAFATAALLAAALLFVLHVPTAKPAPVQEVVASGDTDQVLDFANGSSMALHPHTQLVVLAVGPDNVRVRLERGGVACTVRPGGTDDAFVVEAGAATAALGPGLYEVGNDTEHAVSVETRSGKATVHAADGSVVATLKQGERWSEIEASRVAAWVSEQPAPTAPAPSATAPRPAKPDAPDAPDASQIFAQGERARLEGKSDDAARAFDQLYQTFPRDSRAPIAALEAGRLHLHGHGGVADAVTAFGFARSHAREPFREDAHAGLVESLERSGKLAACRTTRDAFLNAYPSSPHRDKVASTCP